MSLAVLRGYTDNGEYRYVRVDDDGNLIIAHKTIIFEVEMVTTVTEVSNVTSVDTVDEVTHVTNVDSVDKSVSYLTNPNGVELPARGSITGYTLVKETQSAVPVGAGFPAEIYIKRL